MEDKTLPKLLVSREEAEQKIQARIEDGQKLQEREILSHHDLDDANADAQNWSEYNEKLLSRLFDNSLMLEEYKESYRVGRSWSSYELSFQISEHLDFINVKIKRLKGIRKQLDLFDEVLENIPDSFNNDDISDNATHPFGDEIFIVHGRDDGAKETVARFIEKLDLKATILHEQLSSGQTIIEKLEKYANNAGFAIVLFTPDDVGVLKDRIEDESKPRARQNVVFELGFFIGKLGRERVFPLFKGEIEKPSDIDGVIYEPMHGDSWKLKLAQEMKKADFPVDMNKIF